MITWPPASIVALLWMLTLLAITPMAGATEIRRPVLLVVPEAEPTRELFDELLPAVRARLSSLPVEVLEVGTAQPVEPQGALELARGAGALTVAWLAADGSRFSVLSPLLGVQPRQRTLEEMGESRISRCEAMAAMLHAELEVVLVQAIEMEAVAPEAVVPEAVVPDPVVPDPVVPEAVVPPKPPRLVIGSVGYTPVPLSADGPVLHGIDVNLGARFGRFIGVEMNADFTSPIRLELNDGEARVSRVPVRLLASVVFPADRFEPGIGLGGGLEFVQVRGLGYTPGDPEALSAMVSGGATAFFRARFRVSPWLAPFVTVGADYWVLKRSYQIGDETLASRDRLLLHLVVGVSVLLDVGSR